MIRLLLLLAAVSAVSGCSAQGPWPGAVQLFDGETLEGWRKVGGGATYHVDDGAIVGVVGPGSNTFLRTEEEYGDFVLELEFRWDEPGNSGIQFRSHQRDGDGRVFGYQCELDPSPRSWTGGVYDEARRGWLFSLEDLPEARKAVRLDDWNHVRIEAMGSRLRTWVNGVPCADFEDDMDAAGFIALQVHSGETGRIRWRQIWLLKE